MRRSDARGARFARVEGLATLVADHATHDLGGEHAWEPHPGRGPAAAVAAADQANGCADQRLRKSAVGLVLHVN